MGVTITASQLRAIGWYCERHDLVPMLSTPPTFYFKNKTTGQEISKPISNIMTEYNQREKEKKK